MRNLFDQYDTPENRLSHALAVCLHEDRDLLGRFLHWIGHPPPQKPQNLTVLEQSLPGDPPESEDEALRRGLPDIVIFDNGSWCAFVESKIQAPLTRDQLERHANTLRRRGFGHIAGVALTKAGVAVPDFSYPHLTLSVAKSHLEVAVTLPNGVHPRLRASLIPRGSESLAELNTRILKQGEKVLDLGGWFEAYALQRHYKSQRSSPTQDARMAYNLEVSLEDRATPVKHQPGWTDLFATLLENKKANIQFGYAALFPWNTPTLNSREALDTIVEAWCALKPLLEKVMEENDASD